VLVCVVLVGALLVGASWASVMAPPATPSTIDGVWEESVTGPDEGPQGYADYPAL